MDNNFQNQLLYAASRVHVVHYDRGSSKEKPGSATGFFVKRGNGEVWLLTNRHVVDRRFHPAANDGAYYVLDKVDVLNHLAPGGDTTAFPTQTARFELDAGRFEVHRDPSVDIAGCLMMMERYPHLTPGHEFNFLVPELMIATEDDFTLIHAGEQIAFPGYPEWYDHNGERPVFRFGAIVSDPRNDYRHGGGDPVPGDGNAQLAFEATSTDGNSGSPVFVGQRGTVAGDGLAYSGLYHPLKLIGINAGHLRRTDDGSHSGLSYMYKATAIMSFLNGERVAL